MLPKVAIVGRPNVGKSSLLNMLAGRRVSIVDPTAGVTRDRVSIDVELPPATQGGKERWVEVIDTGGYGVYSGDDALCVLTEDIERQITTAVDEAQLVVFVIDAMTGVAPLDQQVARLLRRRVQGKTPIVLAANKVDDEKYEADALEAAALGLGDPVAVSATTKRGKFDLIEAIAGAIDWSAELPGEPPSEMLLAIVGKRNAGKSTFVNALAGAERVIAHELPGTTRDSVDVKFRMGERTFTAIDTAGVRKRKSLADDVEYYSLHRALRSIRRAEAVVLMIDATTEISQVDKKLSGEILKHDKPCVIVVNKWDQVGDRATSDAFAEYIAAELRGLDFAPIVCASALNDEYVQEAAATALSLYEQASTRVTTGELNTCVRQILAARGPSSGLGLRAKVYFVTQVAVNPPTIVLFVNHVNLFTAQYQRYMINQFRERLPFAEVPIKLVIRPRTRRVASDHADEVVYEE